jgi:hypothetical protein
VGKTTARGKPSDGLLGEGGAVTIPSTVNGLRVSSICRIASTSMAQIRAGSCRKVRIAARLRRETTMTLAWTTERLDMQTHRDIAGISPSRRRRLTRQKGPPISLPCLATISEATQEN